MFSRRLIPAFKEITSQIKRSHEAHKPNFLSGFLTGDRWRHQSMRKTFDLLADTNHCENLHQQAQLNLASWAQNRTSFPNKVEVLPIDWGLATFEFTKKHGQAYPVLNMANPKYPGGAFVHGGSAQEENMWHRTNCAHSLANNGVFFDEASDSFLYHQTASDLIEGKIKMTDAELKDLLKNFPTSDSAGHKVLFDRNPRFCFRGPEQNQILGFDDFGPGRHVPDPERSYLFLPPESIFPFYELRSAAPEFSVEPKNLDAKAMEEYKQNLRQRIGAQLDTMILEKKPNVILGAWGCGAFKNIPDVVAQIYREEIEKRAPFFQHIVFPILNTGSKNNYSIFSEHLSGIKLGPNQLPNLHVNPK